MMKIIAGFISWLLYGLPMVIFSCLVLMVAVGAMAALSFGIYIVSFPLGVETNFDWEMFFVLLSFMAVGSLSYWGAIKMFRGPLIGAIKLRGDEHFKSEFESKMIDRLKKKVLSTSISVRMFLIVMLLWALDDHDYGYYQFLRVLAFFCCIYLSYMAYHLRENNWSWALCFVALIYNPFFSFHFGRTYWEFINVMTAIFFIYSCFYVHEGRYHAGSDDPAE